MTKGHNTPLLFQPFSSIKSIFSKKFHQLHEKRLLAARRWRNLYENGLVISYPCKSIFRYFYVMDEIDSQKLTNKVKFIKQKSDCDKNLSIDDIIRRRIDEAIRIGDEKEAKLQLEILEKYLKTAKPEPIAKSKDYKARRADRDKLMNELLKRFEKLQSTSSLE